jgi:hypothetical protein
MIESVEEEVERLLAADNIASEVKYGGFKLLVVFGRLTVLHCRGPRECQPGSFGL